MFIGLNTGEKAPLWFTFSFTSLIRVLEHSDQYIIHF